MSSNLRHEVENVLPLDFAPDDLRTITAVEVRIEDLLCVKRARISMGMKAQDELLAAAMDRLSSQQEQNLIDSKLLDNSHS